MVTGDELNVEVQTFKGHKVLFVVHISTIQLNVKKIFFLLLKLDYKSISRYESTLLENYDL